jgi:hypothetical protein
LPSGKHTNDNEQPEDADQLLVSGRDLHFRIGHRIT